MKRPLHLNFLSGLALIVVNEQCFVFFSIDNLRHAKYIGFKSLRQYNVHAMSWPNVLEHYSCPQMKKIDPQILVASTKEELA